MSSNGKGDFGGHIDKITRKAVLVLLDILIINASVYLSLLIKFEGVIPDVYLQKFFGWMIPFTLLKIVVFYFFNLYKSLWAYASIDELTQIFLAVTVGQVIDFILANVLNITMPVSVYIIEWMMLFLFIGGSRMSYRFIRQLRYKLRRNMSKEFKRVMIVGAGAGGVLLIKEINNNESVDLKVLAAIDDDPTKLGNRINSIPVLGNRDDIIRIADELQIDEIIVAIPSASKKNSAEILAICKQTDCKLRMLPNIGELISSEKDILKQVREVKIEDILSRDEVDLNINGYAEYLRDKVVLITGAGGSIGSEISRQVSNFSPGELVLLDIYENNVYDLQNELLYEKSDLNLKVIIASVRDEERLREIFEEYKPEVVFHAAAHKHVPLMEANPMEAIKNNVFGTLGLARISEETHVKRFVMISTDKAVNPTNIMGASKRLAEMIVQAFDKKSETAFVAVRFGNVLGSNGSVIPLFKKQIARGGPLTVTHPDITRFFMTIPEASSLVITAGALAKGGEIFVLDMGEPVKIDDLAKDVIHLSGLEPNVDIEIRYTGLRPGEKLYEELLMDDEGLKNTAHKKIFVGQPLELDFEDLVRQVDALQELFDDPDALKRGVADIIKTYHYQESEAK